MKSIKHEIDPSETLKQLQCKLAEFQHTPTLSISHDHSTILKHWVHIIRCMGHL